MRLNLFKRLLSAVLSCLLLFALSPAASAEGDILYIGSAEELVAFAENCSYDAWSRGKTVRLEKDISLGGVPFLPAASFSGTFEGGGHTISGLEITGGVSPAGLFGVIGEEGSVQDLTVAGSVRPAGSGEYVGGIAGRNEGAILHCAFSGTVSGGHATGGIVGENALTGTVRLCDVSGGVFGGSMTGGVVGRNAGSVSACTSLAYVNTNMTDPTLTISEFDVDLESGLRRITSPDTYNVTTDSGGIAGFSEGLINACRSRGTVGYPHIGYNVGGIAGRSSGQISACTNMGQVFGRKDVGGIVGLAEPYITLNLTESSVDRVREELEALHTLVDRTASDAAGVSDTVSSLLSDVGQSVTAAEDSAQSLTGRLSDGAAGVVGEINRGGEILDGTLETLSDTVADLQKTSEQFSSAADALDRYAASLSDKNAAVEVSSAADDLRIASGILNEGCDTLYWGLRALRGSAGPKEGMTEEAWRELIYGSAGAVHEMTGGAADMASALFGATSALDGFVAGVRDGTIASAADVRTYWQSAAPDESVRKASAGLMRALDGMKLYIDNTTFLEENAKSGAANIREGLDVLAHGRSGDMGGVFYYASSALSHISAAASAIGGADGDMRAAVTGVRDAFGSMTDATQSAQRLLDYLEKQDRLNLSLHEEDTRADADAFYDSLRGVSDNLELLNGAVKNSSDRLSGDVRAINDRFMALMYALLGVVEDTENAGTASVFEDVSDEDIDAVVNGKITLCVNDGEVSGDIDVGGVAGSMMIYNALNPEGDDELTLSSIVHRTYQLKCILQDCTNTGRVTGKRSNVGAICGDAQLGVISGCLGSGRAISEDGDCVGGIAGAADNVIRGCWARCSLAGRKYIGGIVGSGKDERSNLKVEACRALVEIADAEQYAGAIAGTGAGSFSGNLFVSDTLAGLDRVSVQGEAEPVSYGEMLAGEGVPQDFRSFTLSFLADGEILKTVRFHYGDSFDDSVYPAAPEKEGQYASWDRDTLRDLRFDTEVNAVYAQTVTALPSGTVRSAERPVFFALGDFTAGDRLEVDSAIVDFEPAHGSLVRRLLSYQRSLLEQWQLAVPKDGAATHEIRYLPPRSSQGGLELYLSTGDGVWTRVETEKVGSYLTFQTAESDFCLTVLSTATPWWVWAIIVVFLVTVAGLVVVVLLVRKKPKRGDEAELKKIALFIRRRKRLLIILLAAALVLGAAAVAVLHFAPAISNMELFMLLRSYTEQPALDMDASLALTRDGESFRADAEIFTTEAEGQRVTCLTWQDIPLYLCDGVVLLENGKAFRLDGVLPDYSRLLSDAASLYRYLDVTVSEQNDVRVYHAEADRQKAAELFLPFITPYVPDVRTPDAVFLDLSVADGELKSLRLTWEAKNMTATADFLLRADMSEHTLPQEVRSALVTGDYKNAPDQSEDIRQLFTAWTELLSREPLTANVMLKADIGPFLLDETLLWQRTTSYKQTLSRISRRDTTLYFTKDAASTEGGLAIETGDPSLTDAAALLRLSYEAILLGDADCTETQAGSQYSLALGKEAMTAFAAAVAPGADTDAVSFEEGELRLNVKDGAVTGLFVQCRGELRVVRLEIPASVSANLRFDVYEPFPEPPPAVLAALGLTDE